MKYLFSILIIFSLLSPVYADDTSSSSAVEQISMEGVSKKDEPVLVIREGRQIKENTVAIEATLSGDILTVKVEARIPGERPKITSIVLTGPGIGRVHHKLRKEIKPGLEEEDPYLITEAGGLINFGEKKEVKDPQGTLTKELFQFIVPVEKILANKKYQIQILIESKTKPGKRGKKYEFDLKDFYKFFDKSEKGGNNG